MKKLTLLLFSILIFGCSNDNNNPTTQNVGAVNTIKRITEKTYFQGNIEETSADFNYENGKLKNITDSANGFRGEFSYNGDKIATYSFYVNDILKSTNTFTYSGSNLIETLGEEEKTTYSYNTDNLLISEKEFDLNGTSYSLLEQNDYNYNGNNVESRINTNLYSGTRYTHKSSFDYDSNNNIFKNMNPSVKFIFNFESTFNYSSNNVLKQYSYDSIDSTNKTLSNTYEISYNTSNFPILIKKFSAATSQLISELTIQYN
jgi:hypothetical protein